MLRPDATRRLSCGFLVVELRGFEPLTPCMPCSFGLLPHPRSQPCGQPNGLLEVTVSYRWVPLVPAAYGTPVARRLGSRLRVGTERLSAMTDPNVGTRERWLGPGVAGIGTASFLADVGHEIPTALLPNLLTATLGAPAAALGLIEGISDGLAGAARLAGGALADDPHRRRPWRSAATPPPPSFPA